VHQSDPSAAGRYQAEGKTEFAPVRIFFGREPFFFGQELFFPGRERGKRAERNIKKTVFFSLRNEVYFVIFVCKIKEGLFCTELLKKKFMHGYKSSKKTFSESMHSYESSGKLFQSLCTVTKAPKNNIFKICTRLLKLQIAAAYIHHPYLIHRKEKR
jgi:hypothetical protein